jgi:hypothetical protein
MLNYIQTLFNRNWLLLFDMNVLCCKYVGNVDYDQISLLELLSNMKSCTIVRNIKKVRKTLYMIMICKRNVFSITKHFMPNIISFGYHIIIKINALTDKDSCNYQLVMFKRNNDFDNILFIKQKLEDIIHHSLRFIGFTRITWS